MRIQQTNQNFGAIRVKGVLTGSNHAKIIENLVVLQGLRFS